MRKNTVRNLVKFPNLVYFHDWIILGSKHKIASFEEGRFSRWLDKENVVDRDWWAVAPDQVASTL